MTEICDFPYPIYDQNLRFSLSYLWPGQKFDTLFMSWYLLVTKMAAKCLKSIRYLWPKRLKSRTLWGRAYLYSPYKGLRSDPSMSVQYNRGSTAIVTLYIFVTVIVLQEGTTKLIYAFHPVDPSSETNIPPHDFKSRGARSTLLLNAVDNVPKLPDDTKTFNFTVNKVKLLRQKLTHKCTPNTFILRRFL